MSRIKYKRTNSATDCAYLYESGYLNMDTIIIVHKRLDESNSRKARSITQGANNKNIFFLFS